MNISGLQGFHNFTNSYPQMIEIAEENVSTDSSVKNNNLLNIHKQRVDLRTKPKINWDTNILFYNNHLSADQMWALYEQAIQGDMDKRKEFLDRYYWGYEPLPFVDPEKFYPLPHNLDAYQIDDLIYMSGLFREPKIRNSIWKKIQSYEETTTNPCALLTIGSLYIEGLGEGRKSTKAGMPFVRYAAKAGHVRAESYFGMLHKEGTVNSRKNLYASYNNFLKAAEKGDRIAQYLLGIFFTTGVVDAGTIIVIKNYKEAYNYFKLAADQGLILAQEVIKKLGNSKNVADLPTFTFSIVHSSSALNFNGGIISGYQPNASVSLNPKSLPQSTNSENLVKNPFSNDEIQDLKLQLEAIQKENENLTKKYYFNETLFQEMSKKLAMEREMLEAKKNENNFKTATLNNILSHASYGFKIFDSLIVEKPEYTLVRIENNQNFNSQQYTIDENFSNNEIDNLKLELDKIKNENKELSNTLVLKGIEVLKNGHQLAAANRELKAKKRDLSLITTVFENIKNQASSGL